MSKYLDKTKLDALIKSIATRGAKLDSDIQAAGVSAIAHHAEHGDVTFINRLYLAMPRGARKSAMTSWLLAHAGVVANTDSNKKELPFVHTKDKTSNPEAASKDNWFEHKPDADPDQVFDLQAALAAVLKKAKSAKTVMHGELVGQIEAMLAEDASPGNDESTED